MSKDIAEVENSGEEKPHRFSEKINQSLKQVAKAASEECIESEMATVDKQTMST